MWYSIQIMFLLLSGLLPTLTCEILDLLTSGALLKYATLSIFLFSEKCMIICGLLHTVMGRLVIVPSPLHQEAHVSYKL